MKIIETDNFGGDWPNEKVIASDINWKPHAEAMCKALNERFSADNAPRFFRIVEDDYTLQPGFEP